MEAKDEKPATIDEYLARLSEPDRAALERVREMAKAVVPDAVESISYGLPTLKYRGGPLTYFGAAKKHLALYSMDISGHAAELAEFDTAKGTIRFTAERLLPEALVRSLVEERKAEIDSALAAKRPRLN